MTIPRPRLAPVVLVLAISALLPGQQQERSDAGILLDRIAGSIGSSAGHPAALLDAFESLSDEAACTFAASLFAESLDSGPAPADAAPRLRAIRSDPRTAGPKQAIAATLLAGLSPRTGDVAAVAGDRAAAGLIERFLVIGPFGFAADSLAGFAFPPEREIDLDREHPGYDGPVRWRSYAMQPGAAAADPFEILPADAGATYALAQIHVPSDRVLIVGLEVAGSADLWIDGRPALSIQRRREFAPTSRWVAARFPAGWHRLLVKTTDSGEAGFLLTIRGEDRAPVPIDRDGSAGLRVEDGKALHPVAAPAAGTAEGGAFRGQDVRDLFPIAGARAPRLVAAGIWADHDLTEDAFAGIEELLAAKDLSPGERWLAGRIVTAATQIPENEKKSRLIDLAKGALDAALQFPPAVVALARNEAANDRIEEGIGLLRTALDAHRECVELWEAELELLQTAGFESDRELRLDTALSACPQASKLLGFELERLEKKRAASAWSEVAARVLGLDATADEIARGLAGRLLAARRFDELENLLAAQRALWPHDVPFATLEADLLRERGDAAGEAKALSVIAMTHPRETRALERLAAWALAMGDDAAALRHLEAALDRDGDLHHVRRLIGELRPRERDDFDEFLVDTPGFLANAPGPDAYPDSSIVLLLDQVLLRVHPDGSAEQEIHQLHRLQDARGKEDLGTVRADGEIKVIRTILPDGTSLVPNLIGRGAYEMAGLTPGAIVERRYRRFIDRFRGRPESFGGFYFQDTALVQPFHYTRYVVIVPRKLGLTPVVERFDAPHRREERGDDVLYEFLLERMPRIQREALMPRAEDIVPHVEFRRPDQWDRINRRYLDVYEPVWRPTPPIEQAARKAAGDAEDPVERARRLYEFLMDTVTSEEGQGWPTQTLLEKSGDRFALYLALLRAAGVPHALAMGRAQEKVSPPIRWDLVSEELFDIPLVRIEAPDGSPVYVWTQLRYLPFGKLRFDLTDAPVFVTSPEGGRIERTPKAPIDEARMGHVELELTLDSAGVARGVARLTLHGVIGAFLKEQIERTDKKRLEQMAAQMVLGPIGRLAPQPKGPVRLRNATTREGPLVLEVDVEMRQLVRKTDEGGTIGLPFGPLTLARAFVDRKERKLPFVFHQYVFQKDEARIELDPVWEISETPASFERSGPVGSYRLLRSADGRKLVIRREVGLTPADVPAAEFPGVASFARDVDQAEAQKITLRRETE